ncbi:MAG: hypothetical protein LIR46_05265 [Bacteroidota bacterium]|nr:hypothetical protein [Bacteroidota bacterium]
MLHYHYLITCGDCLDETTHIYQVGIGRGSQADRDYLFLMAYATDNNYFFNLRTLESTEFVQRILVAHNIPQSAIQQVKARDLVRAIKAAQKLPLSQISLNAAHSLRKSLNANYRFFCAKSTRA